MSGRSPGSLPGVGAAPPPRPDELRLKRGGNAFTDNRFQRPSPPGSAPPPAAGNGEVLHDLVIRLAAGKRAEALEALAHTLAATPKLRVQTKGDQDPAGLRGIRPSRSSCADRTRATGRRQP
jgi:hypothetical protein